MSETKVCRLCGMLMHCRDACLYDEDKHNCGTCRDISECLAALRAATKGEK